MEVGAPITRDKPYCRVCGKTGVPLKRCSRCITKWQEYCSRECQKADWPLHKDFCQSKEELLAGGSSKLSLKLILHIKRAVSLPNLQGPLCCLATTLLDLGAHPERAKSHALRLVWGVSPEEVPCDDNTPARIGHKRRYVPTMVHAYIEEISELGKSCDLSDREKMVAAGLATYQVVRPNNTPEPIIVTTVNETNVGDNLVYTAYLFWQKEKIAAVASLLAGSGEDDWLGLSIKDANETIMRDAENKFKLRMSIAKESMI